MPASSIGLFGGSFDPVHVGHLAMAAAARDAFQLDQVRFIPCRISPHKQERPPTASEMRCQMLRLASQKHPWAVVDDIEVQREGPSYSWQTAESMRQQFPDARLYWIMGFDQWQALDRWQHPERLAECVEFIVFCRGHMPAPRDGFRMHAMDAIHSASASAIREALATGAHGHPWLEPEVAEWIAQHRLYRQA